MSKRYLIRRLLLVVPVLLGTILLVFALVFLTPGDPIARLAGNKPLAPSTYAEITARYHLNQPFVVQYLYYIDGLVHGDLGATFTGRDVTDIIKERLPVTLKLTAGSFAVEVVLGLLLALVAASCPRSRSGSASPRPWAASLGPTFSTTWGASTSARRSHEAYPGAASSADTC